MEKKFYDWAKGETKMETIKAAYDVQSENDYGEFDVIGKIIDEALSDTENESCRLLRNYLDADETERAIMDSVLVCLCGWTMETIIEMCGDNRI